MTDDRVARIQQRIQRVILEELQGVINDALRGLVDPSKLMGFIKAMGLDMSQLPGMMGQQPGFDPYQILGLDKSASDEEVKKRYRELINKLHPDKSGTSGTNFLFQMVVAAYKLIEMQRGWQ